MLIQVRDEKVEYLSENLENGLRYIGKAMQCIDEMKQMGGMSQQRMAGGEYGMSGQRHWANQYGSGYSGRREYMGGGYGGQREYDPMAQGMSGQRMPMPPDPMYY